MKSIIKYAVLGLCAVILMIFVVDQSQQTNRTSEIEDSITISMRNALKAGTINKMYEVGDDRISIEFLRSFADNVNTDGDFDIYVYGRSEKGLLDIQVDESFDHANGHSGIKSTRKTLILEQYSDE